MISPFGLLPQPGGTLSLAPAQRGILTLAPAQSVALSTAPTAEADEQFALASEGGDYITTEDGTFIVI